VLRYDVCTGTQLADFATDLPGPCFALRIRRNGEVLVTCEANVVRLDEAGRQIGSTPASALGLGDTLLFAMNLDPDGTSFWTTGYTQDRVVRARIDDGAVLSTFTFTGVGQHSNAGLAVFGEPTAAVTMPPANPVAPTNPAPSNPGPPVPPAQLGPRLPAFAG
jgi:hypothetical protein